MSDLSDTGWYFAEAGAQHGPHSRGEMERFLRSGRIAPETLVWREGLSDWTPAAEVGLVTDAGGGVVAPPALPQDRPATTSAGWEEPRSAAGEWVGDPNAPTSLPGASFGQAVKRFFRRYVQFDGRASRSEYWWPVLFLILASVVVGIVDGALFGFDDEGGQPLGLILNLATLLPSFAVGARRLHDIGRSGWWLLIGLVPLVGLIVLIVFFCKRSDPRPNHYGM